MEAEAKEHQSKKSLMGLPRAQLADALNVLDIPDRQKSMRLSQVWSWLYNKGSQSIDQMTTLSLDLRKEIESVYDLSRPRYLKIKFRKMEQGSGYLNL